MTHETPLAPASETRPGRRCLLVAGMHRSGTSALAQAFFKLGADMPAHILGAEEFNTEGHWEPERLVAVNEELLERMGSRWDDWLPLDFTDLPAREKERYEIWLREIVREEFGSSELFVLKDPRICRMLPFYTDLLSAMNIRPLVVIPFRHPLEVADSLAHRNTMTRAYAALLWLRHIVDAEAASRDLPRSFSGFDRLLGAPADVLDHIAGDLQVRFPNAPAETGATLKARIRPDLQHHSAGMDQLSRISDAAGWIRSAYEALLRLETDPRDPQAMDTLDAVRRDFNAACTQVGAAGFSEFLRRDEVSRAEHARLRDAITAHEHTARRREAEVSGLTARLRDETERRRQAQEQARESADQNRALEDMLRRVTADLTDRALKWETLLIEARQAHADDVRALTQSTSWKVTRPLRGFRRLLTEKGFSRVLLRAAARRTLHMLPLPGHQKRKLSERYHRLRARHQLPGPVPPGAAPPPAPGVAAPEADADVARFPALPVDGRWNVESYRTLQPQLEAFVSALSGPGSRALPDSSPAAGSETEFPLTSLIIRTYAGRGPLLKRALASVAQQSRGPVEVLVVEDGGESLAELVTAMNGAPGVTFRHIAIPKLGRSHAANTGLGAARGDFIGFLDDDDYLLPDHVETLAGLLVARPGIDAAHAAAWELSAEIDPKTGSYGAETRNAVFFQPVALSSDLLSRNHFPIQTVLFRRSACGPQDRFDVNLDALEDWLFWMRLLVGRRIAGCASVTSAYYVPASPRTHQARMRAHLSAEPYFLTQRKAFTDARRLSNPAVLAAESQRRIHAAKRASLAPPAAEPPVSPGSSILAGRQNGVRNGAQKGRIAAYTSINLRYLPKALAWARSVKARNPDWETHILLNDAVPADAASWPCVDVVFPIGALDVPNFHSWAFGMRVVELCTATKPFYARQLLGEGYEYVFYFDPDTHVYNDLSLLLEEFGKDDVLITPHCTQEAVSEAEIHYNEMSSLAHGVFNLGFLGLRNSPAAIAVADFWSRRLLRHCADDHGRGLFTDQKWFNLVPVFFEGVRVLRHKGCNTASWNIASRPVTERDGTLYAGEDPLIFFHFSGYDKNTPRAMFDVFGQFNDTLAGMIDAYDQTNEGFARRFACWQNPWAYGFYDNGAAIPDTHREIYRNAYENELIYETPFFTGPGSFHQAMEDLGEAGISRLVVPAGYIRRYF